MIVIPMKEDKMKTDTASEQYSMMTDTPVNTLIIRLAVPTIISMLVTNIYNMADTFFVSRLGTSASGATGVVFALMAVIQAFGFMCGHGAGSNISRHLGAHEYHPADVNASTGFFLSVIFGCLISAAGLSDLTGLVRFLGSTDTILPYARTYAFYILLAAPAFSASCVLNNILRYEGHAMYAMVGLTVGGVLNIFGDMFLMFCLHMGISGAGLSTTVSQYISAVILLLPFLRGRTQSHIGFRYLSLKPDQIWLILSVGSPSLIRQGLNSVSVMILNQQAAPYHDAAIAAMSIVSRVINLLFCVAIGFGQGFQPVAAFNYGAGRYGRVKEAYHCLLRTSLIVMSIFAACGFLFAGPIISFFRNDPEVISIGTTALRLQCISLILLPVSTSGNMLFQSLGKSGRAAFLASSRSGLFFIPAILILTHFFGLTGIECAQFTADVISSIVTVPFVVNFLHSLRSDG
jgi:putative MATE family efflux protein